jgi:hypothetical protein
VGCLLRIQYVRAIRGWFTVHLVHLIRDLGNYFYAKSMNGGRKFPAR